MSTILKRAAGPVLVAGLVVASSATPAAAAPAPGSTAFRILGGLVVLQARAGVNNQVTADSSTGRLILTDTTGIAIGPGCTRLSATSADCGSAATVTRLAVQLSDGNDTFNGSAAAVSTTVDAGTGIDQVTTDGRNDVISVQDNAGGDTVDCGAGVDTVFADPGDNVVNCERRV
ncbi:MAG: hypothetical protein JF597_42140 [Streptomyces sp.]|uniref:hypothetical protein n=1 Tax=Streptomyces sp. TaxID=1931 RepID=UPI0025DE9B34|nr:hypothetical protein [Streptomyces sp.]MBW8799950.1 hypothetical protein [Streptomyces sp.]